MIRIFNVNFTNRAHRKRGFYWQILARNRPSRGHCSHWIGVRRWCSIDQNHAEKFLRVLDHQETHSHEGGVHPRDIRKKIIKDMAGYVLTGAETWVEVTGWFDSIMNLKSRKQQARRKNIDSRRDKTTRDRALSRLMASWSEGNSKLPRWRVSYKVTPCDVLSEESNQVCKYTNLRI